MDTDVPPSKLGTYDYWNEVYSEEVQNFNDHGDVGEIWFGMDTSKRIINWLSKSSWVEKSDTIIDLGCGNGMLLVGLYKAGFINLHGVDYSEKAIELASSISKSENCLINFTVGSILEDPVPSSYKVVLDKGTYDAISLDPDNSKAKREIYIKNVYKMLKDDGIFLLTSCNWTEDEIIQQFSSSFDHVDTLKAPTFQFGGKVGKTLLPDLIEGFKKFGSTYRHWYSGMAVVFVSNIEDVQTVLSSRSNNRKGVLYKNILPWLGSGLLTSSGQKWHTMRKIITPTFHFSILQGYIDIFNKNAKTLLKVLEDVNKEDCDLAKPVTYCALDNVCETAMGTSLNSQLTKENNEYVYAVFRLGKIVIQRMFSPFYFADHNFWMSSMGREHSKLLNILHGFTSKIIEEKKELHSVKGIEKDNAIDIYSDMDETNVYKRRCSFLEMLLENQEKHSLTAKDIREEVDTFMFEGHDTTAAALTWSLFELGHHPDIQEKVYDELYKIFGDSDRPPTYQDLMEMTYLKRVIQEALRLHPSVPVISRKFDVDLQLRDYVVPADTEIVLIIYHIHRNPEIFPDPEKFDPDRFLPEAVEKRHPFAYIPFSAGQRNCVGQRFAMLEELVVLSSIIRQYKIESLDVREEIKVVPELILRPYQKLRWKIAKR